MTQRRKHVSSAHCQRIPSGFLAALLQEAADIGCDVAQTLRLAGTSCSLADITEGRVADLPFDVFIQINRSCNAALRDHLFRVDQDVVMTEAQFGLLAHCVINSATLADAIQLSVRFFNMFEGRIGSLVLETTDSHARMHMNPVHAHRNDISFAVDAYGFAVMHMFYGWLIDQPIRLSGVELTYSRPKRSALYLSLFDADVMFDQASNCVCFDKAYLEKPVARTRVELEELLQSFPFDLMLGYRRTKQLAERVYTVMVNHHSNTRMLPAIDAVANIFSMTSSTLRRRLAEEGTAYSRIKKDCQLKIASAFLGRSELTVDEIAYMSSFSDPTTFRRAFRQWTGKSPSAYRHENLGVPSTR